MVLTILEAKVDERYWEVLEETYAVLTKEVPPAIKNSFLVQDQSDKSKWRILTVWESQQALDEMRGSSETPTGVVIFQKAHAKPTLEILNVQKSSKSF
jgi:hypothetical protein